MKITYEQKLQLVGLGALAKTHNDALNDILAAVVAITKEDDKSGGYSDDFVYNKESVDWLLRGLKIEVENESMSASEYAAEQDAQEQYESE